MAYTSVIVLDCEDKEKQCWMLKRKKEKCEPIFKMC